MLSSNEGKLPRKESVPELLLDIGEIGVAEGVAVDSLSALLGCTKTDRGRHLNDRGLVLNRKVLL